MTRQSWDSSQICVAHRPVVTRKPYCPQGVRGQRAEDRGGREGRRSCGQPRWLAGAPGSTETCRSHPQPACYPTQGLSLQEGACCRLALRPRVVAP